MNTTWQITKLFTVKNCILQAHEEAAREELPAVKAQPQLEAEPGTSSDEEDADLTKTMNIELIVEKPDIILVEYLTPNSNAIILNVSYYCYAFKIRKCYRCLTETNKLI